MYKAQESRCRVYLQDLLIAQNSTTFEDSTTLVTKFGMDHPANYVENLGGYGGIWIPQSGTHGLGPTSDSRSGKRSKSTEAPDYADGNADDGRLTRSNRDHHYTQGR